MDRRDFLLGSACGLVAGSELATTINHLQGNSRDKNILEGGAHVSFAQQGEDLVMENLFDELNIKDPTYIDIGAFDPIVNSNTYLLYCKGSRGVLVEPNPALCPRLKSFRPKDTVLNLGIGVTDQKEADYYVLEGDGQLNTFSKKEADRWAKVTGHSMIKSVVKMPLVSVNEVLQGNFKRGPDLFSVDTEGFDEDILKSLDFERFRPKVICAETLEPGTRKVVTSIVEFLESKNYSVRGSTFVNSIFLDNAVLQEKR